MTATPCRRDGRGLGSAFSAIVEAPQVGWLVENGFLVGTKVYAPSTPDLKGVHVRHGDYIESELAARVDTPKLVGDIVTHWHRLAGRRKTVVFATSVAHSVHLAREFVKSGVKAEHLDGSTPKEVRDEILERLSSGDLEVVCNCMVLTEGWDQPDVSCAVLARPTKSMGLYRQMAGRVIRTFQGKDYALILDHAGLTEVHGFLHDEICWTLDEDTKVSSPKQAERSKSASDGLVACKECSAIRIASKPCTECGYFPRRPGSYLDVIEGDLAHLDRSGQSHKHLYSLEEKRAWHAMLAHIGVEREYKPGWAAHKFREKFGAWPIDRNVVPIPPNAEVLAWDRHCRIRYAKSQQKRQAAYA
jgi:superfamily II DNA or RNA helicase